MKNKSYFNEDQAPYIVAEMSGNHNQSIDMALKIVDAAADCGVDALKVQTYTAESMTLDSSKEDFLVKSKGSLWDGESLFSLYKKAYTPWEWHKSIQERCKQKGIEFFSSPFSIEAVDFLEDLEVPFYKIASFENTDLELIKKVASKKKPMIISTGMASIGDLELSVKTALENSCQELVLLKCTSSYPASPENTNLKTIEHLREMFGVKVGLSDHTLGIGAACASVAFGACLIEKHFVLDRKAGGVDAAFSLEPSEMKALVTETKRAYQALGKVHYGPTKQEETSKVFRRSIYVTKNISAGEELTRDNIRVMRPGYGLEPKYLPVVLGKKVNCDLELGDRIDWDVLG
ncbi:MAG: pseudaminic acid synthase [Bdellovibrionota bacterium]|nr:pseudaminic acid synthase [Bdellovibrionota bacterium]